jgi:hypothetical protein
VRRIAWLVAGVLVAVRPDAWAQASDRHWAVWASASTLLARQEVGTEDELTGSWVGGGLEAEWRRFSFVARGHTGSLGSGTEERHVRLTDISLRVRPQPWLSVGLEAEALRAADDVDTTVWRLVGPMAGVSAGLGVAGFSAEGEVAYFAIHGVAGVDRLSQAARVEVGMTYAPSRAPASVTLAFRRETFAFSDDRPSEALGGLVMRVRARLVAR